MKVEVAVLGSPVPNSPYGLCGRKATLKKMCARIYFQQLHGTAAKGLILTLTGSGFDPERPRAQCCTLFVKSGLTISLLLRQHMTSSAEIP